MPKGTLVTLEGVDGAGKSTLASALVGAIEQRGIPVELLREPGGVTVSEHIRTLVKDPDLDVAPRAEALLYAAARAQLVEERLRPLLEEGAFVLLDRFLDSSLAYQGAGRALGIEEVLQINLFATAGLTADRTLLLDIALESAIARAGARGMAVDRLEGEGPRFFEIVAAAYEDLARAEPQRIRKIDASQSPDGMLSDALAALDDLLEQHSSGLSNL